MHVRRFVPSLLIAALLLAGCAGDGAPPQLWSVVLGETRPLDLGDLDKAVRAATVVLVGEQHDNAQHHEAQAAIVRQAAADGRPLIVLFEMLDSDQQALVDRYRAHGGDAAGFADAVAWQARGWPDATLYQPLFDAIFDVDATIRAADLPAAVIRRVGREGMAAAPADLVGQFALDRPLEPATAATMRAIQFDAHCRLVPETALGPMVAVQRLRDAAFAAAVRDAQQADPAARVVLIAGSGHVRRDHGVGFLLGAGAAGGAADGGDGGTVLTIGLIEAPAGSEAAAIAARRGEFDIIWVTEPAARPDMCAQLREQFGK